MCGIAGILNFDGQPVYSQQIIEMTQSILHRGPDGDGVWIDKSIGLGHRRLSIIDLSSAGHQPMITQDKRYVISYNGEVYNFKELKKQLADLGHNFISNTDTEVVLKSFAQWGEKFIDKLNGMFAIAVWDREEKSLFLGRDRYGLKPLYYYIDNNSITFASEIKAILKSNKYKSQMDYYGLVEYLTFQNFFTDRTLHKNIKLLMPGHYMRISSDGQTITKQYWDFSFSSDYHITEDEAIEETDRLFQQAIKRQLVSDVPVNSYLSGGIDSGAISIIASKNLDHMKTFTIGFDLSSASGLELSFDEREQAEHISYLAQTEQYEMVLKSGDMERCMDTYVYHLEEPRVGQSYPNYYAAKLASKFGKVVLSGCGGDEIYGGYPWRYFYTNEAISFDRFIDIYYLKWQRLITHDRLKKLLSPIWSEVSDISTRDIFYNVLKPIYKKVLSPEEAFNASLYLESKTFLHGLLVVEDKLSMANSLETRVPFLDNDLVDFATKLPQSLRIFNSPKPAVEEDLAAKEVARKYGKKVLRKTLEKHLSPQIAHAKKQGFSSPDSSWFKGESIEYVKKVIENHKLFGNVFDKNTCLNEANMHFMDKQNKRLFIWSMLVLDVFCRKYIP